MRYTDDKIKISSQITISFKTNLIKNRIVIAGFEMYCSDFLGLEILA